jgi:hypothetical protein
MTPSNKSAAAPAADTKSSRVHTKRADKSSARNAKAKLANQSSTPRRGSKKAKILALLKRPGGASLEQLQKATGWQAHSVRGFLSGTLKTKMGLRVHSSKLADGARTYRLASK